ncbi:MAG: hypothetical protein J6W28_07410, partial [Clostridia bacterium]|nr:hypothetical protein [Clostridia bacterium]
EDEMRVTIIATGFDSAQAPEASAGAIPVKNNVGAFRQGAVPQRPAQPAYTPSAGQAFVKPEPAVRETASAMVENVEEAPAAPSAPTPESPKDYGNVSDDDFGLIMDILNRSKKK